mgnify:CR=1 FL=1
MDHLADVKEFLNSVKTDEYLEPDPFREQKEDSIFKQEVEEESHGDLSGRLHGEVKPWDINLSYAMSEESDEEEKQRKAIGEEMGFKSLSDSLDSTFFRLQKECLDWWDLQTFDLKRRCLERVLVLLGRQLIETASKDKYKDIITACAWQNHHALKEACSYLERFTADIESDEEQARLAIARFQIEKLEKELEAKKKLINKKNKELRKLRASNEFLLGQLGDGQ